MLLAKQDIRLISVESFLMKIEMDNSTEVVVKNLVKVIRDQQKDVTTTRTTSVCVHREGMTR